VRMRIGAPAGAGAEDGEALQGPSRDAPVLRPSQAKPEGWKRGTITKDQAPASMRKSMHQMGNMLDVNFYEQGDYQVQLTKPQVVHYIEIFKANDIDNTGTLNVRELAHMMRTMGHGLSEHDLQKLIMDAGIDQDRNGKLELAEFMEFVRQSLTADLPLSKMNMLEREFKKRAVQEVHPHLDESRLSAMRGPMVGISEGDEESEEHTGSAPPAAFGPDTISKEEFIELMHMMGFHLDETCATDIFKTIDTDHSGRVSYEEFVLGIGVLKRQMTDLKRLEKSFQFFVDAMLRVDKEEKEKREKEEKKKKHGSGVGHGSSTAMATSTGNNTRLKSKDYSNGSMDQTDESSMAAVAGPPATESGHKFRAYHITAKHVRAALKIPKHEAEDLVFVADTENDGEEEPAIDFFEFHELVTNFT